MNQNRLSIPMQEMVAEGDFDIEEDDEIEEKNLEPIIKSFVDKESE